MNWTTTLFFILLLTNAFWIAPNYSAEPSNFSSCTCSREADSLILVAFHDSLSMNNVTWVNEWDFNTPLNTWYGVGLDDFDNCVESIWLESNNLNGLLIPAIGELSGLQELHLWGNNIFGTIPPEIGQLGQLNRLNLWNSKISGPIPASLKNLTNLTRLFIKSPNIDEDFPLEVFDLINLVRFGLGGFTGPIPDSFHLLPNLEHIEFRENNFTGPIPASIGQLSQLEDIIFYVNPNMETTIPATFANLINLENLTVLNSGLHGEIPSFIGDFQKLRILDFRSSFLEGGIPNAITQLDALQVLYLNNCNLSGEIPDGIDQLSNLREIYLSSNKLTGPVPAGFSALTNLERVSFTSNRFTGAVPDLSNLNLKTLWINDNQFESVFNLYLIQTWEEFPDLHRNRFTFEDILPFIFLQPNMEYSPQDSVYKDTTIFLDYLGQTITMDLEIDQGVVTNIYSWYKDGILDTVINGTAVYHINDANIDDLGKYQCRVTNTLATDLELISKTIEIKSNLSCPVSDSLELIKLFNATDGSNWANSWDLTEPVDNWFGIQRNSQGCVERIELSENNLSGNLIDLNLPNLEALHLGSNNLTGSIPNWQLLPNLKELLLHDNQLSGLFPLLEKSTLLESLVIYGNEGLIGPVPDFQMPNLHHISAWDCSFSEIPNFTGLPTIEWILFADNQIEGNVHLFENCPLLVQLDLHGNNLIDTIPVFSQSLWILDLGDNNLSGTLPPNLNTGQMFWLDVSKNDLHGAVPYYGSIYGLFALVVDNNRFDHLADYSSNSGWGSNCSPGVTCGFIIHHNEFTFDDITPNLSALDHGDFEYEPQDSFFREVVYYVPTGSEFILDIGIDSSLQTNKYKWYFENDLLTETMENQLYFPFVSSLDSGRYSCEVTNPAVPDLTLYSRGITIVPCDYVETTISSTLCYGDSLLVNGTWYSQTFPSGTELVNVPDEVSCDSVIQVDLSFYPPSENLIQRTITEGSTFEFGGISYTELGTYEQVLGGQSYTGCDSIIIIELNVLPKNQILSEGFPNAFTPDGDGLNDLFIIPALEINAGQFLENEFLVFNRYGGLLFNKKPYLNDWNGVSNEGKILPTGTYYYLFKWMENDVPQEKKGKLLLAR